MRFVKSTKRRSSLLGLVAVTAMLLISIQGEAQSRAPSWMGFEELQQALDAEPKKVLIHFYADWCVYCAKMEQVSYRKQPVLNQLNREYYAVKFDVENPEPVIFDGQRFYNLEYGQTRNPVHEIAKVLAGRQDQAFTLPAIVILDEQFRVVRRIYRYVPPDELLQILKT